MNDLDNSLKTLARSVVAAAPPAPDFPDLHIAARPNPRRQRHVVVAGVAASVLGLIGAVAVFGGTNSEPRTQIHASAGQDESSGSFACPAQPPLRVTPVGAEQSARPGPAPGGRPPAAGQRVVHWVRGDGSIELRWPAEAQEIYATHADRVSTLQTGGVMYPRRLEVDVDPTDVEQAPTSATPDVIIEPSGSDPMAAPCDFMEVTAVTGAGRWVAGFRAEASGGDHFYEQVDLQPKIGERRAVSVAPKSAIRCQGSDQHGTPANRSGGADPSMRGAQPSEVLLRYLALTPGAVQSGYVEMTEPNGSITYGVDPSGDGWTTLLHLASDGDGWYLDGWTSSGC